MPPLIDDCLTHIEDSVSLTAWSSRYPKAKAAVGILRTTLRRIAFASQAALDGNGGFQELLTCVKNTSDWAINGVSIEQLIDESSLGTPEVKALRDQADPDLVKRTILRMQALEAHPNCPSCQHPFQSTDHDPFCSSCVEAGWDIAWIRGYTAARRRPNP